MFLKYIAKNARSRPLHYLILILCSVVSLVIAVIANGIMMGNIVDSWADYNALLGDISFSEPVKISELRGDIYEFIEKSPVDLMYVSVTPTEESLGCKNLAIWCFPTYDDLERWCSDHIVLDNMYSEKQYNNHEKVAILGTVHDMMGGGEYSYTDDDHVLFGGEEFRIIGRSTSSSYAHILFEAAPETTIVKRIDFELKDYPSQKQVDELTQLIYDTILKDRKVKSEMIPSIVDLLATRKTLANIIMSIFLQIISAFNVMLIFKFMIDSRKKQFAVFRLCGFERSVCLKYSFGELMIISGVSAIISCVAVTLLKPVLSKHYSIFKVMFGAGHLALLSLGFLAAAALVFAIYIIPSLRKTVSRELREM